MKKHNKFLTLVLVVMMALAMVALAACADQQATNDNPEDNQTAEEMCIRDRPRCYDTNTAMAWPMEYQVCACSPEQKCWS